MVKQYKDTLKTLKALANGKLTLDELRPPHTHVVYCNEETYQVQGSQLTQQEYNEWLKSVRDIDRVILFTNILSGNEPIQPESVLLQQFKELEATEHQQEITEATEVLKMPINNTGKRKYIDPHIPKNPENLISLDEHKRFNDFVWSKLSP